jgi:hypothetical protein
VAEVTIRIETSLPGWDHGSLQTVERSDFVDRLIAGGRATLVADPESEAFDQGEEPDVEVDAHVRADADGDPVPVKAHRRRRPAADPVG